MGIRFILILKTDDIISCVSVTIFPTRSFYPLSDFWNLQSLATLSFHRLSSLHLV